MNEIKVITIVINFGHNIDDETHFLKLCTTADDPNSLVIVHFICGHAKDIV